MLQTPPADGLAPEPQRLADLIDADENLDADQKNAVVNAATRSFSVISGGPGSGKTSTVVRILNLLLAQNPQTRIALAAPTGKAAARMVTSIRERLDQFAPGIDVDAARTADGRVVAAFVRATKP